MSIAGTIDAPLELFGGLVTDMAAADLPQGVSPDCQDVSFLQGAVKTRPGIVSVFSPIVIPGGAIHCQLPEDLHTAESRSDAAGAGFGGHVVGGKHAGVLSQIATGWLEIQRRVRHRFLAANISPCTMASLESTFRANTTHKF